MSDLGSSEAGPGKRHPLRTAIKVALCSLLAVVLGTLGLGFVLQQRLAGHLDRIDNAFSGLSGRPSRPTNGHAAKAVNILVLTVDRATTSVTGSGVPAPAWLSGARHVDSLLLLHFDGSRRAASAIALPLDTWVDVPGRGSGELGTSLTGDRPSLVVATLEKLTDVRIDHLVAFDWAGFAKLTDADGGVSLNVPITVRDPEHDLTWQAGVYTVDGARAMAYVGQRRGLPDPVLGQTLRLQYLMRELMDDTLHQEFRKEPFALFRVLDTVSRHLAVESGWSGNGMRNLAISLRNLRSAGIDYLTVPVAGAMTKHGRTVIGLDEALNDQLWQAVRADDLSRWAAGHRDLQVPPVVN